MRKCLDAVTHLCKHLLIHVIEALHRKALVARVGSDPRHPRTSQESAGLASSIEQRSNIVVRPSGLPVAQVAANLEASLCIGAAVETSCTATPIDSASASFSLLRVLTGAAALSAPSVNSTVLLPGITNVSVVVDALTVVLVRL